MKKDIIAVALLVVFVLAVVCFTDIKTPDEYYLEHIDDIDENSQTVTFSISCNTAVDNYDKLEENLRDEKYVPSDGKIVDDFTVVLRKNDTVYDILSRVTRYKKIPIDVERTTKYGSVYVKGINQLYEFSCGSLSGWMYAVNGVFPSVGCSSYTLKDGDVVKFVYTCDLGRDVGADVDDWGGEQ